MVRAEIVGALDLRLLVWAQTFTGGKLEVVEMHPSVLWNEVFMLRVKNDASVDKAADEACKAVSIRENAHASGYRWVSRDKDTPAQEAQGEPSIDYYIDMLRKNGQTLVELNAPMTSNSVRVVFMGFVAPNANPDELTKLMREHFLAHQRGFASST